MAPAKLGNTSLGEQTGDVGTLVPEIYRGCWEISELDKEDNAHREVGHRNAI